MYATVTVPSRQVHFVTPCTLYYHHNIIINNSSRFRVKIKSGGPVKTRTSLAYQTAGSSATYHAVQLDYE